jgi:23S rRNA (cytosine1962-C5)-methyltransferase
LSQACHETLPECLFRVKWLEISIVFAYNSLCKLVAQRGLLLSRRSNPEIRSNAMHLKRVIVNKKAFHWYRTGHPWIYRDDLVSTGLARSGEVVDVFNEQKSFLGKALYGDASKIALRLLTRKEEAVDETFWYGRIRDAVDRRKGIMTADGAVRLIYSEGDGLPGLIADRYAGWLVLQALVPGIDARLDIISGILDELLKPEGIVCRNDASSRSLDGLPLEKKLLRGVKPGLIRVREGATSYLVDVWNGHKTGAYLDQRENRLLLTKYVRRRVLDCFSYEGQFALHLAKSADSVTAVESSQDAIVLLKKNLGLNGLKNVRAVQGNAFEFLRRCHRDKKRFGLIILDPPPLARKKMHTEQALRGYKEINLRAMHLLPEGGVLATFCCSHSIPRDLFLEVLRESATDARCSLRLLEELGQASDHPILLNVPETAYLKGFVLERSG